MPDVGSSHSTALAYMKPKTTPSIGNIFRDLGFRREEAEHLLVRADLMIQVEKLIAARGIKQKAAANPGCNAAAR